jgi:hypothetical protein
MVTGRYNKEEGAQPRSEENTALPDYKKASKGKG